MPSKLRQPIYWNSVDSSGSAESSDLAASRNYVDPWDLENYAYLRRHSIAAATTPQPIYGSRLSQHSVLESDYWYPIREPGYDAPASVEELYFRPPRPLSTGCYYHQPIYEEEIEHYAAPIPLYQARLFELEQAELFEELRTREELRRRNKMARFRNNSREECFCHRQPSDMLTNSHGSRYLDEELMDSVEVRYREAIKPSHMTLNAYGHLKIDYTNSWNSLYRKIDNK